MSETSRHDIVETAHHFEKIRTMLPPDILLPIQIWSATYTDWAGEKRLLWAVLQHAFEDIAQPHTPSCRREHPQATCPRCGAYAWFMQQRAAGYYSFVGLCEFFDLDAEGIRARLSGYQKAVSQDKERLKLVADVATFIEQTKRAKRTYGRTHMRKIEDTDY